MKVTVPLPVEGVLQTVVGARARVGLTFFNADQGGNNRQRREGRRGEKQSHRHHQPDQPLQPGHGHPPGGGDVVGRRILRAAGRDIGVQLPGGTGPLYHNADYGTTNNPTR